MVDSNAENEKPDAASKASAPTSPVEERKEKSKRTNFVRPYPTLALSKALEISLAIKEKNAGNPWPPTQVSKALGIGEKSSALDTMTRASQLYGLTSGTRGAAAISLEKNGREIVYAPNADAEVVARRRAFINVEIFAKVLEYYKGNNLPEIEFLSNTLISEFQLPKEFHSEFRSIFLENCTFCSIGSEWHGLDATPAGGRRDRDSYGQPAIKSFAASGNRNGRRCFVIMPFSEKNHSRSKGFFGEVFDSLIKPAAEAAGFDVLTANKDGSDVIQSTIINEIMDADLVVADLTDHNPNVLFELGLRMSQEMPLQS